MPHPIQRCLKNPRVWQLALACYWLALFLGTHLPIDRLALNLGTVDKFAHVAAFGVLAILVAITWRLSTGRLHVRQLLGVWIIVVLYGAIEETTQPLVNRSASLMDWMADALGASLGLAAYWWWSGRAFDKWIPASDGAMAGNHRASWRRYSVRTLFVVMTVVAVACYWMMLPTMNAHRFVLAIRQGDYATAESLFISSSEKFPGDFKQNHVIETEPTIPSRTWRELWNGERRILVTIRYGDKQGTIKFGVATIYAYRRGLALHPLVLHLPKPPINS